VTDPYGYLRCCAACSAHLLSYATADNEEVYCAKCRTGLAVIAESGDAVRLYARPRWERYCVLARDGDTLTLRRLGWPDADPFDVRIGTVMPEFSYSRIQKAERRAGAG
jgi:hypothetical protein